MSKWETKHIGAGEFKARCLQLMEEVNRTGIELVITKRGRPVARLVPPEETGAVSAIGWMSGTVREVGDIVSPDPEAWPESDA